MQPDEASRNAAERWLSGARRDVFAVGMIFTDLQRLREIATIRGLKTYQVETEFLRFRASLLSDLVEFPDALSRVKEVTAKSVFRELVNIVTNWEQATDVIAAAFQKGNNCWDNDGADIWISEIVFAVNLWRDDTHNRITAIDMMK